VRDIIGAVERHSGCKVPVVERSRRPGDPERLVASAELALNVLGWKPIHDLDSIIATAWAWEVSKSRIQPSTFSASGRSI
jgi:UDP-glucose 4-epimerase